MKDGLRQFLTFASIGAAGFLVDSGVLYLALWLGLGYFAGRVVSFGCAVFFTWQLNRRLTFKISATRTLVGEGLRYVLAMTLGGAANLAVYAVAVSSFAPSRWLPLGAVALGSVAGMIINFAGAKFWVFAGSSD